MRSESEGHRSGRSRWLLAFRLARREFRRHPWRHALVVLMIAVPVLAAMVAFSAIPTVQRLDEIEQALANHGADLVIWNGEAQDERLESALAGLPDGSSVEQVWSSSDWLVTGRQRADGKGPELVGASVVEAPASGDLPRYRVDEGRLPRDGSEVFLTAELAELGPWRIGDRIPSGRSDHEFVVSGVGVARDDVDARLAVVSDPPESYWTSTVPGTPYVVLGTRAEAERDQMGGMVPLEGRSQTLVWLPAGTDAADLAAELDRNGPWARAVGADPVDEKLVPAMALVFAALTAIVSIVSSAAFAIASRRQLRSVGLLATAGADPATIRAALVLQGAFPGLVAGGLALTVGLAGARLLETSGTLESLSGVLDAPTVVATGGVALALVLGVLAGTGAAWLPARSASRTPVLSALAGRRPVGPVRAGVPVTGLFFVAAGAVALAVLIRQSSYASQRGEGTGLRPILMIATVLSMLFGLISLAPTLVALVGSLSARVTGTTRIALRGLARHRSQSAAAVAAVAICLAVPVGVLTTRSSNQHEERLRQEANEIYERDATTIDTVPAQAVEAAVSVRSSPSAMTVQIQGDLTVPQVDDLVAEVEAVVGPVARVRFIAFNDGADGWYTVAAMSPDAADDNVVPWAAEQLRSGGAVALLGRPGPVVLDDDVTRVALDAVGPPDGAPGQIVRGLDADYLVPDTVLQTVAVGRPPLNLALLRPEPLTAEELADLEAIAFRGGPSDYESDWPTLDQLVSARQAVAEEGGAEQSADGSDVLVDGTGLWLHIDYEAVSDTVRGGGTVDDEQHFESYDEDRAFRRWLTVVAVVTGVLSLLVLTITLSLRAVDSVDDHRAAVAAGAAPARMRRQHALEGAVLASLGAVLALPLGWLPVTAVLFGQVRRQVVPGRDSWVDAVADRLHVPGWEVVPILLLPVVAVWVLWMVAPWVRSVARRAPVDQVLPRY